MLVVDSMYPKKDEDDVDAVKPVDVIACVVPLYDDICVPIGMRELKVVPFSNKNDDVNAGLDVILTCVVLET